MDPQTGKAAFRIAFFITFTSFLLLLFLKPGTTEFGVTILTILVGISFLCAIVFVVRMFSQ
jgi:hypothetical protein